MFLPSSIRLVFDGGIDTFLVEPPSPSPDRPPFIYGIVYSVLLKTNVLLLYLQVLVVIIQDQSGWWTGEKGGRQGLFPSNYVELL